MRPLLLLALVLCYHQAHADECVAVEISWVLDVSGTISPNDHNLAKSFIKKVMGEISLSPNGHKAGIAYYGNEGHTHAQCNQYDNDAAFSQAVDTTPQLVGELTNTESGINEGMEILKGCGKRQGVSQGMVLITDGEANEGGTLGTLVAAAKRIQNQNHVQMFAVAVGNFNLDQLKLMMPEENIIKVEDFESLKTVNIDIAKFCKITVPTTTSTPVPEETTTTTSTPVPEETTTTTSTPVPEETTTTSTQVPEETTTTTSTPVPEETTTTTSTPIPEETTTTTSTPVPEETTTTTPTPVPEVTTTTTRESTTTPQVVMNNPKCYCNATNVEKYTCLKWTKFEIIKSFEGTCYVDKLKKAISHIDKLKTSLVAKINQTNACKTVLQKQIMTLKVTSKVFQAYDGCVVLSICKLERIQQELTDKKKSLLKELKYEEEGYGSLKSIGADIIKGILAESW